MNLFPELCIDRTILGLVKRLNGFLSAVEVDSRDTFVTIDSIFRDIYGLILWMSTFF